jgi:hypothetical protein
MLRIEVNMSMREVFALVAASPMAIYLIYMASLLVPAMRRYERKHERGMPLYLAAAVGLISAMLILAPLAGS